jgi:penicillin-binding protein activator
MKKLLLSAALLSLVGCSPRDTKYIEANDGSGIVSLDSVNVQDFALAADTMLKSLYDSPAFVGAKRQDGAPVLMVGRVTNDTGSNFDTSQLVKKMTVSLTKSAKVRVAKAIGFGGPEDQAAAEARASQAAVSGESTKPLLPDYTLSGKILENRTAAKGVQQTSYIFQLSLTEVKTGLAVWEEEKTITKQGSRNSIGF